MSSDSTTQQEIVQDNVNVNTNIDPNTSNEINTNTNMDIQQQRLQLKQQLSAQLLYYFSTKNLLNDVYLQTIMKLNSGHVPVSILSNFSNVNKIIGRSGLLPFLLHADDDTSTKSIAGGDDDDDVEDDVTGEKDEKDDKEDSHGSGGSLEENIVGEGSGTNEQGDDGVEHNDENNNKEVNDSTMTTKATHKNTVYNNYTVQIHKLLREAAMECHLLSLVTLDQNGDVVNSVVDTGASANANTSTSRNVATDAATETETERIIRRLDGIGPSSEFDGIVPEENALGNTGYGNQESHQPYDATQYNTNSHEHDHDTPKRDGMDQGKKTESDDVANINATTTISSSSNATNHNTMTSSIPSSSSSMSAALSTPSPSNDATTKHQNNKTNIIILRDVHEDATEQDIRQVFHESDQILDVVQEFGNCWFVTLGMEHDAKQDIITTMLNLRHKTICSEPIKARLKTQSISSSVAAANSSTSTMSNDKHNSGEKANGSYYRSYYHNGRNPYHHRDGVSNKTSSTGGQHNHYSNNAASPKNNSIYSGDRVGYVNSNNNNMKKSSRGHYFNGGGGSATYYGSQNYQQQRRDGRSSSYSTAGGTDKGIEKGKKIQKNLPPPPPVVEEHYPSLAGGIDAGPSSPASIVNLEQASGKVASSTPTVVARSSNMTGGYAAALLKDAPPSLPSTNATTTSPTNAKPSQTATMVKAVANIPTSKNAKKNGGGRASFHSGKATAMTVDDSSTDDKSSLSSKPELDSLIGASTVASLTSTSTGTVWGGGGRSFADVLKK